MKNYVFWMWFGFILLAPLALGQANPSGSTEGLQQLTSRLQRSPADEELRERIIKLALDLDPRPEPPVAADEKAGAATYVFKNAAAESDFLTAAQLYAEASLLAPWVADYYFNQGVALEKAKRNDGAIAAFNWYLKAAPKAQDARQVRERIGGLKFASKKASDAAAIERAWQSAQRAVEREQSQFCKGFDGGVWRLEESESRRLSDHRPLGKPGDGVGRMYIVANGCEMKSYSLIKLSKGRVMDDAAFARKVDYDDATADRWDSWKATVTNRSFEFDLDDRNKTKVKITISDDGKSITTDSNWHFPDHPDLRQIQSIYVYRRIK